MLIRSVLIDKILQGDASKDVDKKEETISLRTMKEIQLNPFDESFHTSSRVRMKNFTKKFYKNFTKILQSIVQ